MRLTGHDVPDDTGATEVSGYFLAAVRGTMITVTSGPGPRM